METGKTSGTVRALSVSAIVFALLGGAFFWWVPMGMVLNLAGLMFGFVDWCGRTDVPWIFGSASSAYFFVRLLSRWTLLSRC